MYRYQRQETIGEIENQATSSSSWAAHGRDMAEKFRTRRATVLALLASVAVIGTLNPGARSAISDHWKAATGDPGCIFEGEQQYTVQPGDTLWDLAEPAEQHTGAIANAIKNENEIEGILTPGMTINLPITCAGKEFPAPK